MNRFLVATVLIGSLILPHIGLAQLTSENFIVADPVVGAGEASLNGSSENFQVNERFVTDVTDIPDVEEPSGNTSGTRVIRTAEAATSEVVGETDGVRVCLSGNGPPTVYKARVLIELFAANTFTDQGAIVPAFPYDFGAGELSFVGRNWTTQNQTVYNNNCLRQVTNPPQNGEGLPDIETPTSPVQEIPPPITDSETPIIICDGVSQAQKIVTALDGNTLLLLSVPQGSLVSEGVGSGELRLRVGVIEYRESRQAFINLLNRYVESGSDAERATIFAPTPLRSTVLSTIPLPDVISSNPCTPTATSTDFALASSTVPSQVVAPLTGSRLGAYDVNALRGLSIGLLVPSFRIEVGDRNGRLLVQFASPALVELFNPTIAAKAEGLYLVTTTDGGATWAEVPFLVEGNVLRFETLQPGEFYLWSAFAPELTDNETPSGQSPQSVFTPKIVGLGSVLGLLLILYFFRRRSERLR